MHANLGLRATVVRMLLVAPLLAAILNGVQPSRAGAAGTCNGSYSGTTFKSDLTIGAGENCFLENGSVRGGVTIQPGGSLTMINGEIRGSVTATGHLYLFLAYVQVRGSVVATGGTGQTGIFGPGSVRGDVVLSGNSGFNVLLTDTAVRGNATIDNNVSTNQIQVSGNVIDLNLSCSNNNPAPVLLIGGPNVVGGTKSGQCAGL